MSKRRRVLLLMEMSNPYLRKVSRGVATYAHQRGNWLIEVVQDQIDNQIYLKHDPLERPIDPSYCRPDGVIAFLFDAKLAQAVRALQTPVVVIEGEFSSVDPAWGMPNIGSDNEAIGRLGAQELLERGFRQLAFCGIPRTWCSGWSDQREAAFAQYARQVGVPCSIFPGESPSRDEAATVYEQLRTWLKSLEKPVGLMACYDVRARHVLAVCSDMGLLVPEEVAVIGVNNDELMCELTNPPLSSIEQGTQTIGYQAAAQLDQMMAGRKPSTLNCVVPPERIVTRRSSDVMAIDDSDVAAALRFIRDHACEGIQARDVVESVAVSRTVMNKKFRAILGRTIHAEILRLQVEHARQLLATTDMPLNRVALHAGFNYVQQMITTFRRHIGQTPGEYRVRSRGGTPI